MPRSKEIIYPIYIKGLGEPSDYNSVAKSSSDGKRNTINPEPTDNNPPPRNTPNVGVLPVPEEPSVMTIADTNKSRIA